MATIQILNSKFVLPGQVSGQVAKEFKDFQKDKTSIQRIPDIGT